jgi:putative ABC transport system ATP-binding protein
MPMPEAIVELRDLQKSYPLGEVVLPVLKGITLSINAGEYVAIMGPSGSGKSTLLNLLGLLDVPDDGDYFLAGENVSKLPDDDLAYHRNAHIGFIFQSFNLFPQLDVTGNIAVPMIYAGVSRHEARERAEYLAGLVGLSHRLHHRSRQLSGGEMQRTAIARALSNQPPLLLADEPTGNLDEKTGDEIMALFDRLVADGQTLLLVTHNSAYKSRVNRVLNMRDGVLLS